MTRWYQHRFHNVQVHRFVFWIMPLLPRFIQPPIAAVTALIFFFLLKSERRAVAGNLHRVTGYSGLALYWNVYRVYYSFCDLMVSYCYVPGATHPELLSMLVDKDRGAAAIDQSLARGNGLIVWTAHLGNSEIASRLLEMHGRPVNVARVVEDNPAEVMLRDRMANQQLRIVDLKDGARATIALLQALRRNEIVAIQGDRVYHPRHSAALPFFSESAAFPLGPFLLSQVSGAPVLPGFVIRQGWLRYRVVIGDPIYPLSSSDPTAGQCAGLAQAVGFLEAQLSVHYHQWVNFFDFWQVDPRG